MRGKVRREKYKVRGEKRSKKETSKKVGMKKEEMEESE